MAHYSEYSTKPRVILVNNPRHNKALQNFNNEDTSKQNFTQPTNWQVLCAEFDEFTDVLRLLDVTIQDVSEYISLSDAAILNQNPNSMFTRDPIITFPWQPLVAVQSRMSLSGRSAEPEIISKAVRALGVTQIYQPPQNVYLEGGDVYAATHNGARTLYVGIGSRTSKLAAIWLANTLMADDHVDSVVCLQHNKKLLHLDTGFTVLPNKVVVLASQALTSGFIIDKNGKTTEINPVSYFESEGFTILHMSLDEAVDDEVCNMLFVGDNNFISLNMSDDLLTSIEHAAEIKVHRLTSSEIIKANGGMHCLTRQIY